MRLSKSLFACFALLYAAPAASAQYIGTPFTYNYVDLSYVKSEIDEGIPNLDGFRGRLSFDSPDGARVLAVWESTEETVGSNRFKRQDLEAGFGFFSSQNASVDMVLDLKYLRGERQVNGSNETKSGWGVELGLRTLLIEWLEFDFSGEYRDYFQAEFGGRVGAQFQFSDAFSVGAQYSYFESEAKLSAGIRYSF